MKIFFNTLLLFLAALAHAEPLDPLSADAPTPPPRLETGLSGYQPFDEKTIDWRLANDTVREIGGWRSYLREAHEQTDDAPPPDHPHHQ